MPMDVAKQKALEVLQATMNKKYGSGTINFLSGDEVSKISRYSSGIPSVDWATGGGYPKGRMVEIYGPESSGKAQPLSAKILTPQGFKQMKNLEIGQIICAPDGSNTTVIGIYPQGIQKTFRIRFDDKSETRATADHLWQIRTRHSELEQILTTQQLIDAGLTTKSGCRKFAIPISSPLEFNSTIDLPIDPYLLGLLLGDGSFRGPTIKFSTLDSELLAEIRAQLTKSYSTMTLSKRFGDCDYHLKNKKKSHKKTILWDQLNELGLSNKYSEEKFIPDLYLHASVNQRLALLQGLIDTNGSVDQNTGSISFTTSSPKLNKQFQFLARSLGFRVTTSDRVTQYTNEWGVRVDGQVSYRSSLLRTNDLIPARLTRKVKFLKESLSSHRFRFIESITEDTEEECQCIKVSHPDELYITDDFIVTHNTTLTLTAIAEAQKAKGICAFIDAEHALDLTYAQALGVNIDELIINQPDTAEEALDIAEELANSGLVNFIIIDSVAALVPKAELDGDMGGQLPGLMARLMSQACRKLTGALMRNDVTILWINQIRHKIGVMFGSPETTSGGNALKFYASIRLDIRKRGQIKDGETVIANETELKVVKNKTAPPYRVAEFEIEFGKGVNKTLDLVRVATKQNVIQKSGAWYSYGSERIGQGEKNAAAFLEENPAVIDRIVEQLRQLKVEDANGVSTRDDDLSGTT